MQPKTTKHAQPWSGWKGKEEKRREDKRADLGAGRKVSSAASWPSFMALLKGAPAASWLFSDGLEWSISGEVRERYYIIRKQWEEDYYYLFI